MLKEIFKNPNYLIDQEGNVFNKKGEKKSLLINRDGYWIVRLYKNNQVKSHNVHRLVAEAFIPNPENKRTVNHKDGNKLNCHVSNLEWATDSENVLHAISMGLLPVKRGSEVHNAILSEEQVHDICQMMVDGYRNIEIINKFKTTSDTVKNIRAGKCWLHISKDYTFNKLTKRGLSEQSVRWVCNKLEEGFRNKDIVDMSNNPNITKGVVSKLRMRISFPEITKDYNY